MYAVQRTATEKLLQGKVERCSRAFDSNAKTALLLEPLSILLI